MGILRGLRTPSRRLAMRQQVSPLDGIQHDPLEGFLPFRLGRQRASEPLPLDLQKGLGLKADFR